MPNPGFFGQMMDPETMGLLGMSAGLLQAGGPSRMPVSTGQALSQGLMGGMSGYGQGMQLQQQGRKAQMDEIQQKAALLKLAKDQQQQDLLAKLYGGAGPAPQPEAPAAPPALPMQLAGLSPASAGAVGAPWAEAPPLPPQLPQQAPAAPQQRGPTLEQLGQLAGGGMKIDDHLKLWELQNPKTEVSGGYAYQPRGLQPGQFLPTLGTQDTGGSLRDYRTGPQGERTYIGETPKTGAPASLPHWLSRPSLGGPSVIDQVAYDAQKGLAKAGATNVNQSLTTERKYGEQFAGKIADADVSLRDTAMKAPELAERSNRVRQVLASGKVITGTGADYRLALGKAMNLIGASDAETITNTETLVTSLAQNTLDAIKASGLGAGSGFSNADREFLQKAVGGQITLEAPTINRLAELSHRAASKSAERWNTRVKSIPKSALEGTGIDASPITVPGLTQSGAPGISPETQRLLDKYAPNAR